MASTITSGTSCAGKSGNLKTTASASSRDAAPTLARRDASPRKGKQNPETQWTADSWAAYDPSMYVDPPRTRTSVSPSKRLAHGTYSREEKGRHEGDHHASAPKLTPQVLTMDDIRSAVEDIQDKGTFHKEWKVARPDSTDITRRTPLRAGGRRAQAQSGDYVKGPAGGEVCIGNRKPKSKW